MKHADAATRRRLETLLQALRAVPALRERTPGTFYLRSKAFLHFHDDAPRIFADVKLDGTEFARFDVTTRARQDALLRRIERYLSES